jgi:hypothetical protein
MTERLILGIAMVRDEDQFVDQAVRNALEVCDTFVVADHRSRDETPRILAAIRHDFPDKVELRRIRRAGEANLFLRPFVGQPVWVLAVDGDDLYEPSRLTALRERLLSGEFDAFTSVKGNTLHCTALDRASGNASGYLAPPSRTITKLRNFAAIESWTGKSVEHLYGGNRRLRAGFEHEPVRMLGDDFSWSESPFRCLHVCFLKRSSRQTTSTRARRSVIESLGYGRLERTRAAVATTFGRPPESPWKLDKYRQGDRVTVDDVAAFFPQLRASTPST